MDRLLDVPSLHVREHPHVTGIFAQRIPGKRTFSWSAVSPLSWILLRHSNSVKMKFIRVTLREPHQHLVATRKAAGHMHPMFEMPNDSVSEIDAFALKPPEDGI